MADELTGLFAGATAIVNRYLPDGVDDEADSMSALHRADIRSAVGDPIRVSGRLSGMLGVATARRAVWSR
jgi:hypothetical protein